MNKLILRILPAFLILAMLALHPSSASAQEAQDTVTGTYNNDKYNDDGQDTVATEITEDPHITAVLRAVPADTIAALKNQADFAYMHYLDSMLRAEQKAKDTKTEPEKTQPDTDFSFWDAGIVKLICWVLAIGLVGFVLYKLFLGQGVFFINRKQQQLPAVEFDDTPAEGDLEKALGQAIKKQDYRMATRYLFLITLNRLGEKGALQLSTDKTNYQYATELSAKPYAGTFARLSLQYEYVWFGNFAINENQFAALQQQHQQFLKEI